MGEQSAIEWTDATWSPFAGCTPVSPGCKNCYATRLAIRFQASGIQGFDGVARSTPDGPLWTGKVGLRNNLLEPLTWRKNARKIFVNSQSDTFHENQPDERIDEVFGVMLACHVLDNIPGHTFQVLTKRAARMRSYLSAPPAELLMRWARAVDYKVHIGDGDTFFSEIVSGHCSSRWRPDSVADERFPHGEMLYPENLFPLPNVWVGVSIETREYLDRAMDLIQTPAVKRFLSLEPLLSGVRDVGHFFWLSGASTAGPWRDAAGRHRGGGGIGGQGFSRVPSRDIAWVIVGGESGPGARPCHPEWVVEIQEECREAGVPFFFKQWGAWAPVSEVDVGPKARVKRLLNSGQWSKTLGESAEPMALLSKKEAGALLGGEKFQEWPA